MESEPLLSPSRDSDSTDSNCIYYSLSPPLHRNMLEQIEAGGGGSGGGVSFDRRRMADSDDEEIDLSDL